MLSRGQALWLPSPLLSPRNWEQLEHLTHVTLSLLVVVLVPSSKR